MTTSTIWAPKGEQGDPGPQGPIGPQGPVGPQGAAGPDAATFNAFLIDLANLTDSTKGIGLIPTGVRTVDTITQLRALSKLGSKTVIVTDPKRGGIFKLTTPGSPVDNDITLFTTADGGQFTRSYTGPIFASWAGVVGDGVTSDTVAWQKIIDYCSTFTAWPDVVQSGMSYIPTSLVVNRDVLTYTDRPEWKIIGAGANSGFISDVSGIEIFTSTIAMVNDPKSAWITFENFNFSSPDRALGVKIFSKNFLQLKFNNCYFLRVRFGVSDKYWQSIYFNFCNLRYTSGVFISASTGYDVHFDQCISEYGESYLIQFSTNLYGFSFTNGLHEGAIGGLLTGGGVSGAQITGNYIEQNGQPFVDLTQSGQNRGVNISGNFIDSTATNVANSNFYDIKWGNTLGGVSNANYHNNGRLHDNSSMSTAGLDSSGDYAALVKFKSPLLVSRSSGTWTPVPSAGTVTIVEAKYRRSGDIMICEFALLFPAGGTGVAAVISGLPIAANSAFITGSVGYADLSGEVVLLGGTAAPGTASNSAFGICKNKQGLRYTYAELSGVQVAGTLTYVI